LNRFRDRSNNTLAHADFVYGPDGRDFGGGAREEDLVGDVERLAGKLLLDDLDAQVAGDLQNRIGG